MESFRCVRLLGPPLGFVSCLYLYLVSVCSSLSRVACKLFRSFPYRMGLWCID